MTPEELKQEILEELKQKMLDTWPEKLIRNMSYEFVDGVKYYCAWGYCRHVALQTCDTLLLSGGSDHLTCMNDKGAEKPTKNRAARMKKYFKEHIRLITRTDERLCMEYIP